MNTLKTLTERDSALEAVHEWVSREMDHPYLIQYVPVPSLEQFQLRMAYAIMQAAKVSRREMETVLTTFMLIYHGLFIHEEIEQVSSEQDARYRQLSVLAGDYYSSKYFYLLAKEGILHLIGKFAEAVTFINESKVARELLPERKGSERQYIRLHTDIDSRLLLSLADAYGLLSEWEPFILDACETMVIQQEMNLLPSCPDKGYGYHYLTQKCSSSERVMLEDAAGAASEPKGLMNLHVKYGTLRNLSELLVSSYHRTCDKLSAISAGVTFDLVMRTIEDFIRLAPERRTVEER